MKLTAFFDVNGYLTQFRLYEILKVIYPNEELVYNKRFPNSPYTPDFYIPKRNILIEYDGNLHYDKPRSIISDIRRDIWFKNIGIDTLRIPYFIQLNTAVIKDILNVNFNYTQQYPHGFIDKKVVLPAEFSELGVDRFLRQMDRFYYLKDDIKNSLDQKIKELGDERLVVTKAIKTYFW